MAAQKTGEQVALSESPDGLHISRFDQNSRRWIETEFQKKHCLEDFPFYSEFDEIVLSPGVDPRRSFFQKVKGIEKREVDLFCDDFSGRTLAITGTNGKSTLCYQLGEFFKRVLGDSEVFVGGNIGRALFEVFDKSPRPSLAVMELSSFQLERLKSAEFSAGILTNIQPDHLNRYDSFEDYCNTKLEVLKRANLRFCPESIELFESLASFASDDSSEEIVRSIVPVLSKLWGFSYSEKQLEDLPRLPHRFVQIEDPKGGRILINDSKATNVTAASYGMKRALGLSKPVIWALGGQAKGEDYSQLEAVEKAEELWLFGEARNELSAALAGRTTQVRLFASLKDLTENLNLLQPGRLLLFSPACASFDEFESFEERGEFIQKAFPSE